MPSTKLGHSPIWWLVTKYDLCKPADNLRLIGLHPADPSPTGLGERLSPGARQVTIKDVLLSFVPFYVVPLRDQDTGVAEGLAYPADVDTGFEQFNREGVAESQV